MLNFVWNKKGQIYQPSGHHFINSHAQIPTPIYLKDRGIIRIFIATRPNNNLSETTYIDVDAKDPKNVLYIHDKAVLEFGRPGMFDEHGIMPNFAQEVNNSIYLYYIGWSRRDSIPYSNWAGVAISDDRGDTFAKYSPAPIIDRAHNDLYSAGISSVLIDEKGIWHCWYASGIDWVMVNGKYEQTYSIRRAVSNDGLSWKRDDHYAIEPRNEWEAITRPTVIEIDGIYYMWFCFRGSKDYRDGTQSYRIGFAWSDDLNIWHRDDAKAGISVSPEGWDSKMMAYPYVIKVEDKYLMFYNGNYFGKEGFGYAELEIRK